jgi:hypothetical protein
MNHEHSNQKRKTIRIHLPPKPAAPRHPQVMARAIPMPSASRSTAQRSLFVMPLVQVAVASILSMMVLDMGECSHIVAFAALGYAGGLALMAPRRNTLTQLDEFLIRWGFVMLCVLSFILSQVIWSIRGLPM